MRDTVMYFFNGYVFDPNRLLIYKANIAPELINNINVSYDNKYKTSKPQELIQLNSSEMHMKKIAISRAGICLSFNCNLRCQYCGYSSDEQNTNKLEIDDVKSFVRDITMR